MRYPFAFAMAGAKAMAIIAREKLRAGLEDPYQASVFHENFKSPVEVNGTQTVAARRADGGLVTDTPDSCLQIS